VHPVENLVWSKYVQTDLIHGAPLGLTVNDTGGACGYEIVKLGDLHIYSLSDLCYIHMYKYILHFCPED
jgi:hypothetical protein